MAEQIKSRNRGTMRFQISGIREPLYRAYSLVALAERRSLNATLQLAVEEYMENHYRETLVHCEEGFPDEEVPVNCFIPPDVHNREVEIAKTMRFKEGAGTTGSKTAPRQAPMVPIVIPRPPPSPAPSPIPPGMPDDWLTSGSGRK